MSKLVIIDGNAILHRAFHAMPPLTTREGAPINAVYGLISMFLRIVTDLKPEAIAVAFDEKEKTFRHKEFESYQSQRPPTHDDLSSQFPKARDFFKAAHVPIFSKPGYEADDVIGTLAKQATEFPISNFQFPNKSQIQNNKSQINEVIVVTGDKDLLQLVDDKKGIKLYMPILGLSNAKLFGEKETIERMGVPPFQIPDLKSLVGDPSDNYPGVVGIGPKTAEKLLKDFGSVDNIYAHLKDIEPKIRQKLENGKVEARLFHRLATVVRDVPVEIDFPQMENWKIDSPEVLKLFEEYGFKTLTDRIKKVGKSVDAEKQTSLF